MYRSAVLGRKNRKRSQRKMNLVEKRIGKYCKGGSETRRRKMLG